MCTEVNKESPSEDFRMLYQIRIDDIRYIKGRQWAITYYLLLLFAALIGFSKAIGVSEIGYCCWQKWVLSVLAIGILALGIHLLWDYQKTLARYRRNLVDDIVPNLSGKFKNSVIDALRRRYKRGSERWGKPANITWCKKYSERWCKKYTSNWRDFWSFTVWLGLMLVAGAFLVLWYSSSYDCLLVLLGCSNKLDISMLSSPIYWQWNLYL